MVRNVLAFFSTVWSLNTILIVNISTTVWQGKIVSSFPVGNYLNIEKNIGVVVEIVKMGTIFGVLGHAFTQLWTVDTYEEGLMRVVSSPGRVRTWHWSDTRPCCDELIKLRVSFFLSHHLLELRS